MLKVIFSLMLPLVLLGFLMSSTLNMHGDMEQLKLENQKLSHELNQLRSQYQALVHERDAVLAENASLKYQFDAIQTAYLTESQARIKAESDLETYKSMVFHMGNPSQTISSTSCLPADQHAVKPGELLLSNIAPVGASSLITLAMASLVAAMINYSRKQKRIRNLPAQIRTLHRLR